MDNLFDNRPFDVGVFANYPKCTGVWRVPGQRVGCLLTALFAGFDIEVLGECVLFNNGDYVQAAQIGNILPLVRLSEVGKLLNDYALSLGVSVKMNQVDGERVEDFCNVVIHRYDNQLESKALDLVWELIERLPNKVGCATKQDVAMPAACALGK